MLLSVLTRGNRRRSWKYGKNHDDASTAHTDATICKAIISQSFPSISARYAYNCIPRRYRGNEFDNVLDNAILFHAFAHYAAHFVL